MAKRRTDAKPATKMLLWGRAAGRCQFRNCGKRLDVDLVSANMKRNSGYVAHIVAADPGGARGDDVLSPLLADNIDNLMLACDTHHREIDDKAKEHIYTVEILTTMKREQEARVDRLLSPRTTKAAHVLQVSAPIGPNETAIVFDDAFEAVADTHTLGDARPTEIKIRGMRHKDSDPNYYDIELGRLRGRFDQDIRWRFEEGDIEHLAVFALAPIPILIELGRLISDISSATVYQAHREPQQHWSWWDDGAEIDFSVVRSTMNSEAKRVALKLEVSSEIADRRVEAAVREGIPIWSIRSSGFGTSVMRNKADLGKFRQLAGQVLDEIKNAYGSDVEVLVFPAIPNAVAVEFGRVWQPKAHPSLSVFDEAGEQGFKRRLSILREGAHPEARSILDPAA